MYATINIESLAGDIVSIYDQVTNRASYFPGSASSTKWNPLQDCLLSFIWNARIHICLDKARTNSIDRDIKTSQFHSGRPSQANNAYLGGSIVVVNKVPNQPNKATNVNN